MKENHVNINLKKSGQNSGQKGRPPVKSTRIEEDIRARLERGEWNRGDLLPTEADLTAHYGVSRMTLRQAINPLEEEGLIIRKRGKGTFAGDVGKGHSSLGPIAVILNDSQIEEELSYHDQLGRGVRMGLEGENVPLIYYHLPQERGSLMDLVENDPLQASHWGGILTLPCFIDSPSLIWAEKNHIPLVSFSEPLEGQQVSCVELDHEAGGVMAMDYLIRTGRTKPLIIDNRGESSYARGRERGIRRALESHGIEREERFFLDNRNLHSRDSQDSTAALVTPFLVDKSIDCILVYMEHPTIGVYRALEQAGIIPGEAVGVMHINDYPWLCQVLNPQPSAIRQPFDVVARDAALMLLKQIREGVLRIEKKVVKPHLIIRET